MSKREEPKRDKSDSATVYAFDAICDLIRDGHYDRAVDLIQKAQEQANQAEKPLLTGMISSAYGMCLAFQMFRAISDCHDCVINQIKHRELEMALHLQRILKQAREYVEDNETQSRAEMGAQGQLSHDAETSKSVFAPGNSGLRKLLHSLLARNISDRPVQDGASGIPESEGHKALLAVYCLGPFQVYHEGQLVTEWNGDKGLCIFKYLVANQRKPVPKDILMDVFWPEADPEAARRNLHQGIYCLRESFRRFSQEIQHVLYKNDCYSISPELDIWIDADEFEKRVRMGRRLEASGSIREAMAEYAVAEELYQGDFMEEELYSDWPAMRRHHLRDLYIEIADLLTGFQIREKNYLSAVSLCRKVLTYDACSEEAHLRLMQCYLSQGQVQLAIRQFHACVQALKNELDVPPSPEIRNMYDRIMAARR